MASWAPRGRNPDDRPAPRAPGRVNGIRAEIPWRSRGGVSGRSGLVNGAGRVNGSGFVNGSGLVNGAGFVNGSGYVNGLRRRPPLRLNHAGVISRRDLRTGLALAVVLVVGMPTLLILLSPGELALTNIQVDGSPADWDSLGVPLYVDAVDGATGDTSLTRYGHAVREGTVSLAAEVRGTMFGDATGLDGVYFFLDADGDTASGFRLSDLGADRMVRAVGGSGTTQGAYLWDWTGGADQYDWNGWKQGEGLAAAASGRFLEVQGFADDFGLESGYGIRVAVADYSGGAVQSSVRFGAPFGALRVEQRPLATSVTGSAAALLELQFTAFGGPVAVAGVSFGTFSPAWLMNITSIQNLPATVNPLQPAVATVTVDAGILTPGTYVTLGLPLVTADRPVTLSGTLARAYAGPAPSGKVVDGLFGDWSPADLNSDPAGDAGSPSTDITNWGSNVTAGDFSFYLETPGSLLSGGTILETVGRITSSGGQSQPSSVVIVQPRNSGEDFVRVYVDRDPGNDTGTWIHGIYADHLVSVAGRGGRVTQSGAYMWTTAWTFTGAADFLFAGGKGEGGFSPSTPLPGAALVVIETTPWAAAADSTDPVTTRGTRGDALPRPMANPSWPGSWNTIGADDNEAIGDNTLDLLDIQAADSTEYLYIRLQVEGTSPVLTDNTWWVYLDLTADGDNDWVIEERPAGSGEVCSFAWGGSSWGTGAPGCDVTDTIGDSDQGSAVRVVASCNGTQGCIDFALEKIDYPGLGATPRVTAADDQVEDLSLESDGNRNPSDASPCSVPGYDDCSSALDVPEFPLPALAALAPPALLLARRRATCSRPK